MAKGREQSIEVRAKVAHIQPGTLQYRSEGERFTHTGELYKHVTPVKGGAEQPAAEPQGEEQAAE